MPRCLVDAGSQDPTTHTLGKHICNASPADTKQTAARSHLALRHWAAPNTYGLAAKLQHRTTRLSSNISSLALPVTNVLSKHKGTKV